MRQNRETKNLRNTLEKPPKFNFPCGAAGAFTTALPAVLLHTVDHQSDASANICFSSLALSSSRNPSDVFLNSCATFLPSPALCNAGKKGPARFVPNIDRNVIVSILFSS